MRNCLLALVLVVVSSVLLHHNYPMWKVYSFAVKTRVRGLLRQGFLIDRLQTHSMMPALNSAYELGVFEAISAAPGGLTFDELCAKLQVSRKGLDVLLVTLVSGGYVQQDPTSKRLSCLPGGGVPEGAWIAIQMEQVVLQRQHYHLKESIRTGEAEGLRQVYGDYASLYSAKSDVPELVRYWEPWMKSCNDPGVTEAMIRLLVERSSSQPDKTGGFRMLDWCGSRGYNSVLAAKLFPSLNSTVMDLPSVTVRAEKEIRDAGMEARVKTLPADLLKGDPPLPAGHFDGVLMDHTIREWSGEQLKQFWRVVHNALKPGGSLVLNMIADRRLGDFPPSYHTQGHNEAYFLNVASHEQYPHHIEDVSSEIRAAGLEIVEFAPVYEAAPRWDVYETMNIYALVARKTL